MTRVRRARDTVSLGKLSGAVGTFTHLPPSIEADVDTLKIVEAPLRKAQPRSIHTPSFSGNRTLGTTRDVQPRRTVGPGELVG